MKVVAINGSARKDGNTASMVRWVFDELEKEGIETELIQLAGKKPAGCLSCYQCFVKANRRCAVDTDVVNDVLAKMDQADGIILASPVYFANITSEIKALIDRAGFVSMANGHMFARKVGAAVVAARRAGAVFTFDALNHFFFINQMIVPGSNYWNMGYGLDKGEVEKDAEGRSTMSVLGQNMAWLLKKIHG